MPTQLDTLPPEILFNILSFTEPTCNPTLTSYSLNAIAETNKQLNAIVEEYARSLLKQHANITPPKHSKTFTCRKRWLADICQFCKKTSKRTACFYPTLTCCDKCDRKQYPKMTMTKATQDHHLSKLDLFTPNLLHPHLPSLAVGTIKVMGGDTTLISEADVLARREYIHRLLGDKAKDPAVMRVRPATHERIIKHLNTFYDYRRRKWRQLMPPGEDQIRKGPKSMATEESRRVYADKALKREWAAARQGGMSKHTAIELE
ncbi:hypothetical protein EJ02DRAFT_450923 [Clathrospora elynae]|uniref:F-box domain-containing protein n=1 Tax=Clathrospora elynae TaxID=706981 RepID=A0A6A5T366_9PLEO|nr:hypothetical protein EJ02DRAFT_450923 [Clathrospora elynae]